MRPLLKPKGLKEDRYEMDGIESIRQEDGRLKWFIEGELESSGFFDTEEEAREYQALGEL